MSIEEELKHYFDSKKTGKEECALVVENRTGEISLFPCRNIHETPETDFLIQSSEFIRASFGGKVIGVAHSHVNGNSKLSSIDKFYQHCNRLIYWLYFEGEVTKHEPVRRLKGRVFKEGYSDCYDIMKDFYYLCGVDMGDYSPDDGFRIPDWHRKEGVESPFIENIEKEGFFKVEKISDIMPGDVIISLLASNVPNHCLIYFGGNRVFHHLPERLSGEEALRDYFVKMRHSIWRHKDFESLPIERTIDLIYKEPSL